MDGHDLMMMPTCQRVCFDFVFVFIAARHNMKVLARVGVLSVKCINKSKDQEHLLYW